MAKIYSIKGLILEEVLLNLLKVSGYYPVSKVGDDNTLKKGKAGIEVKGRGWNHQIDAIADFNISPPFSYPLRLLLEAKFYSKNVGIEIVRNAVGVLKDINEYWVSNNNDKIAKPRFHYQYAIFTSSSFTFPAQKYAFAQDIYLIKLENNKYFLPIIEAIENLDFEDFNGKSKENINIDMSKLRKFLRKSLQNNNPNYFIDYCNEKKFNITKMENLLNTSFELRYSFLGVLGNRFPIFLTPSPTFNINELIENNTIRICWDDNNWYIIKEHANCRNLDDEDIIFSFDLPNDLFELYADNNMLSSSRALDLKQDFMSSIKITFRNYNSNIMSSIDLKLDNNWINNIRANMST